jgi:hypothetical protein
MDLEGFCNKLIAKVTDDKIVHQDSTWIRDVVNLHVNPGSSDRLDAAFKMGSAFRGYVVLPLVQFAKLIVIFTVLHSTS